MIDRLDHLVLTVADLDATCAFYGRVLGMTRRDHPVGPTSLHFGDQKINLHQRGREFEPKSEHPTPGSGDLCFTTQRPIEEVVAHLKACGVEIIEGPVMRAGARARLMSVYFRDPDANLIEVSNELEQREAAS